MLTPRTDHSSLTALLLKRLYVIIPLFLFSHAIYGSPESAIEQYFSALEKTCLQLSEQSNIRKGSPKRVAPILQSTLKKHIPMDAILRVNSKGIVINEILRGNKPIKKFRDISHQKWFDHAGTNMERYYGWTQSGSGPVQLFWAYPLIAVSSSGAKRSAGALLFKINSEKVFSLINSKSDLPFRVSFDNQELYHSPKAPDNASGNTRTITIRGLEGVTLLTYGTQPASAETNRPSSRPQGTTARPGNGNEADLSPRSGDRSQNAPGSGFSLRPFIMPVIGGVAFLVVIIVVILIQRSIKKHNEDLMRRIDGGMRDDSNLEAFFENDSEGVSVPESPARFRPQTVPPPPETRVIQVPTTDTGQVPLSTAPEVTASPQPPQPPQPQAPLQSTHTPTGTIPPAGTGMFPPQQPTYTDTASHGYPPPPTAAPHQIPEHVYNQIRQDITNQITSQIQTQYNQDLTHARKTLQTKVGIFARTMETHLGELLQQSSDTNVNPEQLRIALQSSIFKLKQALEGFYRQP